MCSITFLSTLSLRRATVAQDVVQAVFAISIHALLAESDVITNPPNIGEVDFYPRSPCGERRQSTSDFLWVLNISIHALLAESDVMQAKHAKTADPISIHALLAESDSPTAPGTA